jgi:flagellar basal-body rod modification protein FlgD
MRIDGTTDPSTPSTGGGLAPTSDEFLRLFVAQLEHQDPLDPADPSDMVAQLAQLTNVEQTAGMGARLDALIAQQASATRASLLGVVGRTVEARADHVTVTDASAGLPVIADLPRAATDVTVVIRDASGAELRRVPLGARPAGEVALLEGVDLPPGTYQLEIEAVDASGAAIDVAPRIRGTVSQLAFADAATRLRVAGIDLDPGDITSVS